MGFFVRLNELFASPEELEEPPALLLALLSSQPAAACGGAGDQVRDGPRARGRGARARGALHGAGGEALFEMPV